MNWLDRAIASVSPGRALRREQARRALSIIQAPRPRNQYDGATTGRRAHGWRKVAEAPTAVDGVLERLRNNARDMVRNNAYAARGVQAIVHNVIGPGITPQATGANDTATARLERMLVDHFDTTAIDAHGLHDLYGLQSLAMRSTVEAGEVLIRRRWRRFEDNLPLPFQIELLEVEHLDTSKDGTLRSGGRIEGGVEFDAIGRRVAYHLFRDHPNARMTMRTTMSSRVPADDVIHLYRVDRPGQSRGVSWFAPIMLTSRDFDDYEDAQLMRQKIAACFTAFVTDADGGGTISGDQDSTNADLLENFEPGIIEQLPPGKDIRFADPPGVEGYGEFANITLHKMAAGLGVTYEALTGDLRGVNFSSGRMGWLEFQRNIDAWRWHMVVPRMLKRLDRWFLEAVQIVDQATAQDASLTWTPPRREMIDPTREIPAVRDAIRAGLKTPSEAARENGFDPEQFFAELAADFDRLDRLNLTLDSDPRRVSRAGMTQARPADSELPSAGGESEEGGADGEA